MRSSSAWIGPTSGLAAAFALQAIAWLYIVRVVAALPFLVRCARPDHASARVGRALTAAAGLSWCEASVVVVVGVGRCEKSNGRWGGLWRADERGRAAGEMRWRRWPPRRVSGRGGGSAVRRYRLLHTAARAASWVRRRRSGQSARRGSVTLRASGQDARWSRARSLTSGRGAVAATRPRR